MICDGDCFGAPAPHDRQSSSKIVNRCQSVVTICERDRSNSSDQRQPSAKLFQLCLRLAIAVDFLQHVVPEPHDLGVIAAFGGQIGQVALGEMTEYALIDAAKLVRPAQPQDLPLAVHGFS